jgi:hypothetical protein
MAEIKYNHISKAAEEFVQHVKNRRAGKNKSLRTSSKKLNNALLDGID